MYRISTLSICFLLVFLSSCISRDYVTQYSHLNEKFIGKKSPLKKDYSLTFLVDARHLDYSNTKKLVQSLAKNPLSGRKGLDVGHAWVFLRGKKDGKEVILEGGHSGEWGVLQPKYFEGIMNYRNYGYSNPSEEEKKNSRVEENPIKYLWASLYDGIFQRGNGGHTPTFAARISLSEEQFFKIENFMEGKQYNYNDYALTRNQCSSFLAQIAALADFEMEDEVTVELDSTLYFAGEKITLWKDHSYSQINFSSPDVIEKSLMKMVSEGKAEYAVEWYQKGIL
jgi:hypothetical protein